jgi:CheY-like chemotaxis protein
VSSNQIEDKIEVAEVNGRTSNKANILVAEDVEVNQLLIMKILASSGKYFVDIVGDGDQVIERLHQQDYDLILMDLKMSKMDGYDATRFIRQSEVETIKNIPIIALTANVSSLEREVCLGIGMNEYVGKPYKEKELISKIDALIKK